MEGDLDAAASLFAYDDTSVDMGAGIVVDEVYVDDGWNARAAITIEADATLG